MFNAADNRKMQMMIVKRDSNEYNVAFVVDDDDDDAVDFVFGVDDDFNDWDGDRGCCCCWCFSVVRLSIIFDGGASS